MRPKTRSCEITRDLSRADLVREGGWMTSKRDHVRSCKIIPAAPQVHPKLSMSLGQIWFSDTLFSFMPEAFHRKADRRGSNPIHPNHSGLLRTVTSKPDPSQTDLKVQFLNNF